MNYWHLPHQPLFDLGGYVLPNYKASQQPPIYEPARTIVAVWHKSLDDDAWRQYALWSSGELCERHGVGRQSSFYRDVKRYSWSWQLVVRLDRKLRSEGYTRNYMTPAHILKDPNYGSKLTAYGRQRWARVRRVSSK